VHDGPQEDQQKAQGDAGEIADILADALVWVINLCRDFDIVESTPLKILAQKIAGQPFPPAQSQIGLHILIESNNWNTQQKAGKVHTHKQIRPSLVLVHQGIGKKVTDIAEAHINPGDRNRQKEHDREQHPWPPARAYMATKGQKTAYGQYQTGNHEQHAWRVPEAVQHGREPWSNGVCQSRGEVMAGGPYS